MFKIILFVVATTTVPTTPTPPPFTITHQVGGMQVGVTREGIPVKILASGGIIIGDMYYPPMK